MKQRLTKILPFGDGSLTRSSAQTLLATGLMLMLNLATGVLVARFLGTAGRGEIAAIVTLGQTLGWAASMGCFQAVVFAVSRRPQSAGSVLSTWMLLAVPLGLAGTLIGELLVGTLFSAQTDEAVWLARLWLLMVPLMPLSEALGGVLVADHRFSSMNAYKLLQAGLPLIVYVALLAADAFTVETVLATHVLVVAVYLAVLLRRVLRAHRLARPSAQIARRGLSFGARAQASNIGVQVNARLDLMIMPALLVASQVGLYAVAVSIATMIVTLAGSLAMIALPVAASGDSRSVERLIRVLHGTAMAGIVLATGVFLLAPQILGFVYSQDFADAAGALRILAPGAVLLAMSNIVVNGLYGQNRPATAGLAQVPGVLITIVGLALFLAPGGIEAAAWISTTAYATSLVFGVWFYRRGAGVDWKTVFDFRPTLRMIARRLRTPRVVPEVPEAAG